VDVLNEKGLDVNMLYLQETATSQAISRSQETFQAPKGGDVAFPWPGAINAPRVEDVR
jgi:hypothetical protein